MLLITEHAKVVDHLKGLGLIATITSLRFRDLSTLDVLELFLAALGALEASLLHFWFDI